MANVYLAWNCYIFHFNGVKNLTSVDFRTVDVPCRIFSLMVTIKIKAAMGIIIQRFSFFFFFEKLDENADKYETFTSEM